MKEQLMTALETWCGGLEKLILHDTGDPRLDGAIACPSCLRIHGRCFEAMLPFLYLGKVKGDARYVRIAEQLFHWADETLTEPDGSFLNDIDATWKGTTTFNVIQLAECLFYFSDELPEETRERWLRRITRGLDLILDFPGIRDNNINYSVAGALALWDGYLLTGDERYRAGSEECLARVYRCKSENGLLFGEGAPRDRVSERGCLPIDIGYNVEESLPLLTELAYRREDPGLRGFCEDMAEAHRAFFLEDGAWDNSFGTRNYKWTYWGSRTTDGCLMAYLSLADETNDYYDLALRNLELLLRTTAPSGLLMGGPDYLAAGQPICSHHSFTHAKEVAGILCRAEEEPELLRPKGKTFRYDPGWRYFPELATWIVAEQGFRMTVTSYDWHFFPGDHVSGGTLSYLAHEATGPIFIAGMTEYSRQEAVNMQVPRGPLPHASLAPRIELSAEGEVYASVFEDRASLAREAGHLRVKGCLRNRDHEALENGSLPYALDYSFADGSLVILCHMPEGARLILPILKRPEEPWRVDGSRLEVQKSGAILRLELRGASWGALGTEGGNAMDTVNNAKAMDERLAADPAGATAGPDCASSQAQSDPLIYNLIPGFTALCAVVGQGCRDLSLRISVIRS